MSLLQSTGSLTMNAAWTLSEKTSFLGALSLNFGFWVAASLVAHFLYGASGSMFSKHDAYSSIERTFLKIKINRNKIIRYWRWRWNGWIHYSTKSSNIRQVNYLKTLLKTIFWHHSSRVPFSHSNNKFIIKSVNWKFY